MKYDYNLLFLCKVTEYLHTLQNLCSMFEVPRLNLCVRVKREGTLIRD